MLGSHSDWLRQSLYDFSLLFDPSAVAFKIIELSFPYLEPLLLCFQDKKNGKSQLKVEE